MAKQSIDDELFVYDYQLIILDVRVPCTPVARLNNHRACVNGIAWAPHSSCHICTAGMYIVFTNLPTIACVYCLYKLYLYFHYNLILYLKLNVSLTSY